MSLRDRKERIAEREKQERLNEANQLHRCIQAFIDQATEASRLTLPPPEKEEVFVLQIEGEDKEFKGVQYTTKVRIGEHVLLFADRVYRGLADLGSHVRLDRSESEFVKGVNEFGITVLFDHDAASGEEVATGINALKLDQPELADISTDELRAIQEKLNNTLKTQDYSFVE